MKTLTHLMFAFPGDPCKQACSRFKVFRPRLARCISIPRSGCRPFSIESRLEGFNSAEVGIFCVRLLPNLSFKTPNYQIEINAHVFSCRQTMWGAWGWGGDGAREAGDGERISSPCSSLVRNCIKLVKQSVNSSGPQTSPLNCLIILIQRFQTNYSGL